jgi:hypothetical protein
MLEVTFLIRAKLLLLALVYLHLPIFYLMHELLKVEASIFLVRWRLMRMLELLILDDLNGYFR